MPPDLAPGAVRVDARALRRAMRRRNLDLAALAFGADLPRRVVRRALDGEATSFAAGEMADVLGVPLSEITGELSAPANDE